ncbi:divergent polysaccharide deacetylase family protein [Sulfurimonas sp. SAG-AH-194-I05]|nr:divergent polysaccharide deacetylase family protein [Sulfurimonas sp. SAG-AH-194-I05]MDF1875227.1 divergent polysaccharide deacetylase family protein [Sulfurimonas sp. SAG-AH-194-I05]
MAKRRKNKSKSSFSVLKFIAWFLALVIFGMSVFAVGYYFGYEQAQKEELEKHGVQEQKKLDVLKRKNTQLASKESTVNERLKKVLKKEAQKATPKIREQVKVAQKKNQIPKKIEKPLVKKEVYKIKESYGSSHEYADESLAQPPIRVKRAIKKIYSSKPKLAIIIDDVSVKSQVNAVKSLGLDITMSFLPPSPSRPHSAKLAANEDFYMVHLPMEAQNYSAEEPNTLRIYDSQEKISYRVAAIKKLFPKVRYINNHTGSKFTANEVAMNKLVVALKKNYISFIDSRTTAKTKVPTVMKNFGYKYVARDVFLDHHMDKPYILKQIKEAIRIAKSEGLAIAIGHPHANTILALHESKKLFKDVDLVFINKIY